MAESTATNLLIPPLLTFSGRRHKRAEATERFVHDSLTSVGKRGQLVPFYDFLQNLYRSCNGACVKLSFYFTGPLIPNPDGHGYLQLQGRRSFLVPVEAPNRHCFNGYF